MTATNEMDIEVLEKRISATVKSVNVARAEHEKCVVEERNARMLTTNALNRLNAAQKEFDKAVSDMRKMAPSDSDWNRKAGVPA